MVKISYGGISQQQSQMKKKRCFFLVFILLFLNLNNRPLAQSNKIPSGPLISPQYYEGENLIYDCEARHWACVADVSFEVCSKRRKLALEAHPIQAPPCNPIKTFLTKEACFKHQLRLTDSNPPLHFCKIPKKKLGSDTSIKMD